jgi:hypothetical protein
MTGSSDFWICPAGHCVNPDLRPVHERCGDPARRHPQVTFYNAISTTFERHCYATADEAFDAMVTVRPFNNTDPVASWCVLAHCPHGCRTVGGRGQPVVQEPVVPGPEDDKVGVFRCPACRSEYVPGEWPAYGTAWMTDTLHDLGLLHVGLSAVQGPAGMLVAVDATFPPGNTDVAGWALRIHEAPADRPGAGRNFGSAFREPLMMYITEPGQPLPAEGHSLLSMPKLTDLLRGYL